ncbi:MAG: hypothetical protein AAB402_02965 [Patescibacteria group bacterium]
MSERYVPPEAREETHEWSTDETVDFIKNEWKGFFHNHPQERVRDPQTPQLTMDVAKFFTGTWRMPQHGTLGHMEKAYKITPEWLRGEAEQIVKEKGGIPEDYADEALQRILEKEFHQPADIEQQADQARQASTEEHRVIGGAEVDMAATVDSTGRLTIAPLTAEETLRQLDVDYLVFSLHADTDPLLREIARQPGDPEKLTQIYESMANIADTIRQNNPSHPLVLAGHPLSRAEARSAMSRGQKARVIQAFTDRHIPLEISLNDYYWWRPRPDSNPEQDITTKVPLLDPEMLNLIKESGALVFVDTDLHFGDWLRDRQHEAKNNPKKLGRAVGDQRDFSAQTMDDDLTGWPEKRLMELPRYLRPQVARFIRVVKHLLNSGIKPEQIANTKTIEELRQIQSED